MTGSDDNIKRRLTEPNDLFVAAERLLREGVPEDAVAPTLVRYFHVDLDLLKEVLSNLVLRREGDASRAPVRWRRAA